ncbi:MAG: hypothetical protein KDD62_10270, partial [Bdellovibrionales bacterium]|nr:hypothetical protein [Bdellovibrionales bacterium]
MKQFVISLFISLPLLIANSAHAEAEPCGVNFDDMSIKIGSDYLTELTQISSAGKYRLACNGTVIAD